MYTHLLTDITIISTESRKFYCEHYCNYSTVDCTIKLAQDITAVNFTVYWVDCQLTKSELKQ